MIQQASDREKQRDSQLATALAAIQTQKRTVRTPQQAAQQLASVLPLLPLPVSVHDPDLSVPLPPGETPAGLDGAVKIHVESPFHGNEQQSQNRCFVVAGFILH